jgi:hypothetical protein
MTSFIQRSFSKGEIAPSLYGRVDTALYSTALRTCKNFIVMRPGGVQNRPGSQFVCEVKDSTKAVRLIEFVFNNTQTYILEFGDLYMRVIREGEQQFDLTLTITGITQASPAVLTYTGTDPSNGEEVYISDVFGMSQVNGRNFKIANVNAGANTFELQDMDSVNIDSSNYTAYSSGGTAKRVYTITTPYLEADLSELNYSQSGDVIYIVHPSYAPRTLSRTGHTTWTLAATSFTPTISRPTNLAVSSVTGGANTYRYKVTAIDEDTGEESFAGLEATQAITGITNANPAVLTYAGADSYANGAEVYITGVTGMTEVNGRTFTVANVNTGANTFELLNLNSTDFGVFSAGGTLAKPYVIASAAAAPTVADPHTLTWTAATNAKEYNIYREDNGGGIFGLVGVSKTITHNDNATSIDTSENPPETVDIFTGEGEYPSAVGFYQQRAIYANTDNEPERVFASRTGFLTNFGVSKETQDDDSVDFTLAGRKVNEIVHVVELERLLLMTTGNEVIVNGDDSGALTPTAVNSRTQTSYGSDSVRPVVIGGRVVFVQSRGQILRDIAFKIDENGYRGADLTIPSSHLFRDYTLVDMAYQQNPDSIIWVVRSDGALLGLTYVPEQQVFAWHRHETEGLFENVCVVPESTEDKLYAVVNRTIDGSTRRYIERFHNRDFTDVTDVVFVDSSLSYNGENAGAVTMTLSGGTAWTNGESLTLTASAGTFVDGAGFTQTTFVSTDIDNQIHISDSSGNTIRFTIRTYSSSTVVTGTAHNTVPTSLRSTAVSTWSKAVKTISGLWHLEGENIAIFADGNVVATPNNSTYETETVSSGSVTMSDPYVKIHAGLGYTSDLETLDIDSSQTETISDKHKNIGKVFVQVENTRGVWAGVSSSDTLNEVKQRDFEDYGEPTDLETGVQEVNIEATWNQHGRVFIRIKDPVPASILSITSVGFLPFRG